MNNVINPDNAMVMQSEGHWQKYAAFLLWKLGDGKPVSITVADIENFSKDKHNVLLIHGHYDSIEFKLVTEQEAMEISNHDAMLMSGRA